METSGPVVYIVDDDEAVSRSIAMLCGSVGIGARTYATAQEFLADLDNLRGGAIVLDMRLPGINGLDLQQRLRDRGVHTPVIIVTGYGEVPDAVRAIKGGAFDFLEKPLKEQPLLMAIQKAVEYDALRRQQRSRRSAVQSHLASLTSREHEILRLVLDGCNSRRMSERLGISRKTVDYHRKHLLRKMHADSVVGLLVLLKEAGLSLNDAHPLGLHAPQSVAVGV